MLFVSLFLAGFTIGVFTTLKIFAPEKQEELWDPQHFPQTAKGLQTSGRVVTSVDLRLRPQPKRLSLGVLTKLRLHRN